MSQMSRTGLVASPTKKVFRREQLSSIQLRAIARPAPFILKPFGGFYNPYPHGCSLLCNHPTDNEAKELLKKAKDSWANDGKTVLLAEEIEAIRAGLEHITELKQNLDTVPEELFRKYTETDSRPLTPAPTLASAATRASGSRRCVTPDPIPTNQIREKTRLVLDLRRSHSQETMFWHQEPPVIKIEKVESVHKEIVDKSRTPTPLPSTVKEEKKNETTEEEFITRRGKKRRKKRGSSKGPPVPAPDPETQVGAGGSHNASARPSLGPASSEEVAEIIEKCRNSGRGIRTFESDSYLDVEILRQLRRELNEEIVENEFNDRRRLALKEALKTISKEKGPCEALLEVQKELRLPSVNTEFFLSLPRVFSRSSCRFELPLDSRTLEKMTPLEYLERNVFISSPRKLLYNCIFNKFKMHSLEEKKIHVGEIQKALDLMMGKGMSEKQSTYFRELIGWNEKEVVNFKTFCGVCALCERLLAPMYCAQLPDRINDPCHEIETTDFEGLERKLHNRKVDPRLVEILKGIKNL